MDQITIAIAGLGSRGRDTYARYAVEKGMSIVAADGEYSGHGGGDARMFDGLIRLIFGREEEALTSIGQSVAGHLICFAAGRSRLNGGQPERL